ncbi:DUF2269 family protein [Maricaulis salignorans]|uniref:Uncharacterized membrane protein n=1 Tax=Maricaulis salignorans TaxID=144026 RepID=A0A1G9PTF0_9PROT|nr:DUF2269 domain-containing protein [Maricaulis salignorans]SDM02019.1 Uncharacterized membrane protein [Maricaulis salignorans]
MEAYWIVKTLHILSACVLFGSGAAIAFFMLMAWRSGDAAGFALAAKHVVLADWIFTTSAVIAQPLTGIALAHLAGWPLTAPWLMISYGLYIFIGACWLPVVWIQLKVRQLMTKAVAAGQPVPDRVHRLMRIWFLLGWPAFLALIMIFALMVSRPAWG